MTAPDSKNAHVLLLEDDDDIRDLLSRLLSSYGCRPALASTWADVERFLAAGNIKLALLDIMLPGADGREVAALLHDRGCQFPIYFMTGMHAVITDADREHVAGVLYKPFTVQDLRKVLDATIGPSTVPSASERQALALMAAVASEHEALRRQESRLQELANAVGACTPAGEVASSISDVAAQHKASLDHLGGLLADMRRLLQQEN